MLRGLTMLLLLLLRRTPMLRGLTMLLLLLLRWLLLFRCHCEGHQC